MRAFLLLLHLSLALGWIHNEFDFDFPSCKCHYRPVLQSIQYFNEKTIERHLHQWEHKVTDVRFSPWHIHLAPMNFTYNATAVSPAFFCHPDGISAKQVSYRLPVDPPGFLRPFVGNILAHQDKTQYVLSCMKKQRFLFQESCTITNLPIIGSMHLGIFSMFWENHSPVARVHLDHTDLPWYMSFVEGNLQNEIVTKAKRLWKIVVSDLCGCTP